MSGIDRSHHYVVSGLFRAHYPWLCARLRQHVGCGCEDIAAEAFVQLLEAPKPLAIREPRALLTTITRRLIYQLWRRRNLERQHIDHLMQLDPPLSPSPEELAQSTQALQSLDRALSRLPDNVRATFLMSRVDGLTYPQIAAELGISVRSVSVYMTRSESLCVRHSANQTLNRPLQNKRSA